MNRDHMFQVVLIIGAAIFLPVMVYHRARSQATGETLDRWQEGMFIFHPVPIFLVLFVVFTRRQPVMRCARGSAVGTQIHARIRGGSLASKRIGVFV